MPIHWGEFSSKSRKALRTGWMITAGLIALYLGFIQPRDSVRGIAMEKSAGLAAVAGGVRWEPVSLWRQASILPAFRHKAYLQKGIIRGVDKRVPVASASLMTFSPGGGGGSASQEREFVRTASLDMIVKTPSATAQKVIVLAQAAGGFLVTSNINGGADATSAALTVRVPAAKFDEVSTQIRNLGLRVENESVEAQDVTRQYVDQGARLRNLRAQEQQYLGILRKAGTVKDTLEVSDKINEVRGAIEERQAEFEALSKQVETIALNLTLRSEADARVFGLNWRPLYQLKIAAREGIEGLGDYASSMAAFVFYLPTVLLWLFTIVIGAAVGWRILKWAARTFFHLPKTALAEKTAS